VRTFVAAAIRREELNFSAVCQRPERGFALADNDRMPPNKLAAILASALLACLAPSTASAQGLTSVGQSATKVSEHDWTIIGFPNIGIVVGQNALTEALPLPGSQS
jgi:hypothetical protein